MHNYCMQYLSGYSSVCVSSVWLVKLSIDEFLRNLQKSVSFTGCFVRLAYSLDFLNWSSTFINPILRHFSCSLVKFRLPLGLYFWLFSSLMYTKVPSYLWDYSAPYLLRAPYLMSSQRCCFMPLEWINRMSILVVFKRLHQIVCILALNSKSVIFVLPRDSNLCVYAEEPGKISLDSTLLSQVAS